jgi:hypothetical protein
MPECDSRLQVSVKTTTFLLSWANGTITPARGKEQTAFCVAFEFKRADFFEPHSTALFGRESLPIYLRYKSRQFSPFDHNSTPLPQHLSAA